MQKVIFSFVVICLLLSCDTMKGDEMKDFIPGTYVRFSDHEMRTEYDTLTIEAVRGADNQYRLIRTSYFQKKLDDRKFPWENSKEELMAIYDEDTKFLKELKKGKVISFFPQEFVLHVGTTEYKKLK